MPIEVFDGRDADHGDEAYLSWARTHLEGYIINTWRHIDPNYMSLHRPWCESITNQERYEVGAYTERQLIKVCADTPEEARDWIRQNGRPNGSFTSEGCSCLRALVAAAGR